MGPDTAAIDEILQLIGVFVSFSIAFVSYKGVRRTDSTTLMRLTTAFVFLGLGFLVEGLVGLSGALPWLPSVTATMVVLGLVLETTGYFFLAFSHAIDVMLSKRLALGVLVFPVLAFNGTEMSNLLSILSFYFVLYGVVETLYSYKATRRPDTLLIAGGLALLASGILAQWLSIMYISVNLLPLVEILLKEMGLMMLFVPVLGYVFGREKVSGPI
ncbi:MAG TPA: hypothetical protein VLY21_03110 [Nitrososphaerales archaeon]|nr:hypothetical protein [Nitrososphaerales archaeon]HUK74194.1 hypothetical protein [Nitrososphaerales archaeon]